MCRRRQMLRLVGALGALLLLAAVGGCAKGGSGDDASPTTTRRSTTSDPTRDPSTAPPRSQETTTTAKAGADTTTTAKAGADTTTTAGNSETGTTEAAPKSPTTTESPTTTAPAGPKTTTPKAPKSPTTAPAGDPTPGTTAAPGESKGCEPAPVPPGASARQVIDVDGDARADTAWVQTVDTKTTVGIVTAAGTGATTELTSDSPTARSVLVADADDKGPVELLFDDGRQVELYAYVDCAIQPVRNPQGGTYTFSLGLSDVGTGVGCVDTPGGRRLAGLDRAVDPIDDKLSWARTIVELDALAATNGERSTGTYELPGDQAKADLLSAVTCGDLTMAADGISG